MLISSANLQIYFLVTPRSTPAEFWRSSGEGIHLLETQADASKILAEAVSVIGRASKLTRSGDECAAKARFSLHAMRHAAASLFIEQGWPPKKIQTMLGHSSITMIYEVYGHWFHDPAKDLDLMGEMGRGLLAA